MTVSNAPWQWPSRAKSLPKRIARWVTLAAGTAFAVVFAITSPEAILLSLAVLIFFAILFGFVNLIHWVFEDD